MAKRLPKSQLSKILFVQSFFAWGLGVYAPAIYLVHLTNNFGWAQNSASTLVALHFLAGAFAVNYLPRLFNRLGSKWSTIIGLCSTTFGACLWTLQPDSIVIYFAPLISGLGWGLTSAAAITIVANAAGPTMVGSTLAVAFTGASFAGLVWPAVFMYGFTHWGGAATIVVTAMAQLAIVGFGMISLGCVPIGRSLPAGRTALQTAESPGARQLQLVMFLSVTAQIGIATHALVLLGPRVGLGIATIVQTYMMACAILGRFAFTSLSTSVTPRRVLALSLSCQTLGLLAVAASDDIVLVTVGFGLIGLAFGPTLTLPLLIANREFSDLALPLIIARIGATNQIAFVVGPLAFGYLMQLSGSDFTVLAVLALFSAVATLLSCYRSCH